MNTRGKLSMNGWRVAATAILGSLVCGVAGAQVVSTGGPAPGGNPPPIARPHGPAQPGVEVDIVKPQFVVPDTGICLDASQKTPRPVRPIRIDHRRTDIPVFVNDPASHILLPSNDKGNNSTRSQPLFQNFDSMGPNDLTPPDPDLATNGTYIVAVNNDDFAVYDICGQALFSIDAEDYFGYSTAYLLFDPKVIYDPWNNRWVMLWHKKRESTEESTMIIAVTSGSTPFGLSGAGAYWYDVPMVQDDGTADESWADYYDLGYSNTAITFSGNQFRWSGGFRWGRIRFCDKATLYAADTTTFYGYSNLTNPDGSATSTPRSVKMQWSWSEGGNNIDALYINARGGGGSRLTLRKIRTAFTGSNLTAADINVASYTSPPNAVQPNGLTLDTIDCRLMIAVATADTLGNNGIELFTGLTTGFQNGTTTRCHLFKIDPVNNALEWEAQFGATDQFYWFPSVVADYSGSAVWTFTRTDNSTVEPEARYVDYNKGVFSSASSLLRTGDGNYNGFRWGDYFGGQLDWADYNENFSVPGRPAKMWFIGEYGEANSWSTHIGATSVFTQGDLSNVTPATDWNISGVRGSFSGTTSRVYTLTHTGETGVRYQVTSLPAWLDATPDEERLDQDDATVTLVLDNAAANLLAAGNYTDTVTFSDCFNGGASFNREVNLTVQAPNLDIITVDVTSGTYRPGDNMTTSIEVQNIGTSATGAYSIDFYASTNATISTGDIYIETRNYGSLAAGASRTTNHILSAPCITTEGLYYIGAIATVTNDSSTANNTGVDLTRVTIEFCPADIDESCFVDFDDFVLFVKLFELGEDSADFDESGFVDLDDFIAYVGAFENGC